MAGTIYSGTYVNGVVLSNPATQRPVTVTGKITDSTGDAVYGAPIFAWAVANRGTIDSTGGMGSYGIHLAAGGNITNTPVGVGPTSTGGLIEGCGGLLIEGAAGFVTNLGTILGTGANTNGVLLTAGGRITNGSAADTTALISDPRRGVGIDGGAGAVTNFGTIENAGASSSVVLKASGTVINGSSTSTAALIASNGGTGVYITGGAGTVTNFGTIHAYWGINLLHVGGRITNGSVGVTSSLIEGTAGSAAQITGTAGTILNYATIQSTDTRDTIDLLAGGEITNGSAASAAASISNTGGGTAIFLAAGDGDEFRQDRYAHRRV